MIPSFPVMRTNRRALIEEPIDFPLIYHTIFVHQFPRLSLQFLHPADIQTSKTAHAFSETPVLSHSIGINWSWISLVICGEQFWVSLREVVLYGPILRNFATFALNYNMFTLGYTLFWRTARANIIYCYSYYINESEISVSWYSYR